MAFIPYNGKNRDGSAWTPPKPAQAKTPAAAPQAPPPPLHPFETYQAIIGALPSTGINRWQYERACGQAGFQPVPDAQLGDYGDRYGEYTLRADGVFAFVAERILRQLRWEAIKAAPRTMAPTVAPAAATTPPKAGQLWEECGRCGAEPVYMPLHLCAACWPR